MTDLPRLIAPLFTLALVIITPNAVADNNRASLLDVYRQAVQHDAQLSAARHDYLAKRESIPQARAGLLPTLNAGSTVESVRLQRDEPGLTRTRSNSVFQANLNQPLFRADRWFQLEAAHASTSQAELELEAKEQQLILNTAKNYFETLRALDLLAASKAEEAALKRQQQQAQARLDNGASSITDVLDAQAAYDNASANRRLAQRKVDDAYEGLSRLTNQDYSAIEGIEHQLPVALPAPCDANAWVSHAVKQNLALQASQYAVIAAEQTNRQRKAGFAPTVDAVASWRKGDNDGFGYSNPTDFGRDGYRGNVAQGSIGIELNIPLYSGGMTRSQVREATERLAQSEDEREDRRREVVQDTRNFYRAVNSDIEQVIARRQTIRSGQASVKANQAGRDLGSRNTADVLNAERQLYAAVREYNNARYDYIIDTLKLKQAAGMLSPTDLHDLALYLNKDYDADRDFLPPQERNMM
ncbi:TolC family outer membrane protein [Pseudomonas sp. 13B_3.2_Bac1]|jgi:outer membrane protein|uniref:TolC family outer membrane protein n=1 Tax=Pseudomonas sp. 13B_3.2_Bac1 TaxID=2971623 RepID=UPI0021CA75A5|nr:TolC family outer membrane protein [Pseudomonas sp. 13B_3.2_Bac1]MCU1775332.1 TolC family outer membrane protein [Pseudomonas sp. 13B_3.2_Bac1]